MHGLDSGPASSSCLGFILSSSHPAALPQPGKWVRINVVGEHRVSLSCDDPEIGTVRVPGCPALVCTHRELYTVVSGQAFLERIQEHTRRLRLGHHAHFRIPYREYDQEMRLGVASEW